MRRGDLVTVAIQGAYGKPRPALVIQSDLFAEHPAVTILPVTSELRDTPLFRIGVVPSAENGLRKPSQVMVDKPQSVPRENVGVVIGTQQQLADLLEHQAGDGVHPLRSIQRQRRNVVDDLIRHLGTVGRSAIWIGRIVHGAET